MSGRRTRSVTESARVEDAPLSKCARTAPTRERRRSKAGPSSPPVVDLEQEVEAGPLEGPGDPSAPGGTTPGGGTALCTEAETADKNPDSVAKLTATGDDTGADYLDYTPCWVSHHGKRHPDATVETETLGSVVPPQPLPEDEKAVTDTLQVVSVSLLATWPPSAEGIWRCSHVLPWRS